jgi:hypothetical protein
MELHSLVSSLYKKIGWWFRRETEQVSCVYGFRIGMPTGLNCLRFWYTFCRFLYTVPNNVGQLGEERNFVHTVCRVRKQISKHPEIERTPSCAYPFEPRDT